MRLNRLENKLFEDLLRAELDVPFNATVSIGGNDFDLVLEPAIDSRGYFAFNYFNATSETGDFKREVDLGVVLGIHPELYRAWTSRADVTIRYRTNSLLFSSATTTELPARVGRVNPKNRGRLLIRQNIVKRGNSRLNRAEFCIVDFPDFRTPGRQLESVKNVILTKREDLQGIASDLGDDARITVSPTPHQVVLCSDDGWKIAITKDDQETRGMVSHTGLIEKSGSDDFSEEELHAVLESLKYFFAFAAGTYCHYTTVVGYGSDRRPIWGMIGKFEGERHRFTNWFGASQSVMDGIILEELFPSFWRRWQEMKDELIAAIECYVHSNAIRQAGIPADAVAKGYAGLEILAGLLSGETIRGGGGDAVDDQLRANGVPHQLLCETDNPVTYRLCKTLIDRKRCGGCCHGAHLLNDVRNYIAHPLDLKNAATIKQKFRESLDSEELTYPIMHDLSQFYFEYLLLGLCEVFVRERRRLLESLES